MQATGSSSSAEITTNSLRAALQAPMQALARQIAQQQGVSTASVIQALNDDPYLFFRKRIVEIDPDLTEQDIQDYDKWCEGRRQRGGELGLRHFLEGATSATAGADHRPGQRRRSHRHPRQPVFVRPALRRRGQITLRRPLRPGSHLKQRWTVAQLRLQRQQNRPRR